MTNSSTHTRVNLSRQRILMDLVRFPIEAPTDDNLVIFADHDDTEERPRRSAALHHQDWVDLGSPETITVTVEPGDHLNDGEG